MTDDRVDRLVRDADPYRPELIDLRGAEHDLLEEIMSVPTAQVPERRPRIGRRLAVSLATAAAVVGVAGVTVALHDQPRVPAGPAAGPAGAALDASAVAGSRWTLAAVQAAQANPRLLIGEPGWKATNVSGFTADRGAITFEKDGSALEMNWYPAKQYPSYFADRKHVSEPEPGKAGTLPGDIFTYDAGDFALMLKPHDGTFVELRTGGIWTRARFDEILAGIKQVDVDTWLAALPPEIVTPARAGDAAAEVLAGIPLPPGFDTGVLRKLGVNDKYQFAAGVTSKVGCAWIAEWQRADKAGDAAARSKAAAALRGSHNWAALKSIENEGGWSEVFWDVADHVAKGQVPADYRDAIGCQ
ncbi:hypothetical protein GCM10010168_82550 [Actinoplanes ianthinogenes]|uniref:hypothetical protein n=1 Tax=Actinoplanes ianthinogenes TaxID=122358 RepID=UPI0016701142|nr:hypothetical protein [Actinoplanes ianthinogenes]GGR51237.1 hypothetical protein GCM10010168_82550 [Actinoplanes ianthinogenes]